MNTFFAAFGDELQKIAQGSVFGPGATMLGQGRGKSLPSFAPQQGDESGKPQNVQQASGNPEKANPEKQPVAANPAGR